MPDYALDSDVINLANAFGSDQGDQDEAITAVDAKATAAQRALSAPYQPFASHAQAEAATIPAPVQQINVRGRNLVREADGTALITVDGGEWSPADEVYADQFGDGFDGVADDLPAMQKAVAYAIISGKRVIKVPSGVVALSGPLEIDGSGVIIEGAGRGPFAFGKDTQAATRIIPLSGFVGTELIRYKSPASGSNVGNRLRNLTLDGLESGIDGIVFEAFNPQPTLENVYAFGCRDSYVLNESCWGPRFICCASSHTRRGWELRDKNHNAVFMGCVGRGIGTPEVSLRIGAVDNSSSIAIIGCDFETNGATTGEIYLMRCRAVKISGCYFEGRAANATILVGRSSGVASDVSGVSVDGCYFQGLGVGTDAIRLNAVTGLEITGNDFRSYTRSAVHRTGSEADILRVRWRGSNSVTSMTAVDASASGVVVSEDAGDSGTFTTTDGKTITVENGQIVGIV